MQSIMQDGLQSQSTKLRFSPTDVTLSREKTFCGV